MATGIGLSDPEEFSPQSSNGTISIHPWYALGYPMPAAGNWTGKDVIAMFKRARSHITNNSSDEFRNAVMAYGYLREMASTGQCAQAWKR